MSEESLIFIHKMFSFLPGLSQLFQYYEARHRGSGFRFDFERANWRPPLVPRMAYDLEQGQIHALGLRALVSITDHDNIEAPMLLRTVSSARGIPVSTEWSVPVAGTEFHLGIHNMPAADAAAWMQRFDQYRKTPGDAALRVLLHELHAEPGILVVLNHPLWDLHAVGRDAHHRALLHLLALGGDCFHALELNGLRDARENRAVARLAEERGALLIGGGDRHSLEPNAVINLSEARNFREFVDEIRIERRSEILFMRQYLKPWQGRILHSTLDAVTDFPEFPQGWQRWQQRCFHPDHNGVMRSFAEFWPEGYVPLPLRLTVASVRLARSQALTRTFNWAFPGAIDSAAEFDAI
jgi:hypothetical protein